MTNFRATGAWEQAIEAGRLIEVPVAVGALRLPYRTAFTLAAWNACIASTTRQKQNGRLLELLSRIDFLLDMHPDESVFEFNHYLTTPENCVPVNLLVSLNTHGHCVMTIDLGDGDY